MPEGYEWLIGELRIFIFCFIKPVQERGKRREKSPAATSRAARNTQSITLMPLLIPPSYCCASDSKEAVEGRLPISNSSVPPCSRSWCVMYSLL